MRILITDDCSVNRMVQRAFLQRTLESIDGKHTIDEAVNGQEAVERYEQERYNVVFMDYMMPVMDGLVASEHILGKDKEALVVLVTAYGDRAELVSRMGKVGVSGCIDKPVRLNELSMWIEIARKLSTKETT